MNNREKQNLDNYITGHYGEDQFKKDPKFAGWMKQVDSAVQSIMGCSVYDLPDCCFADWYEDGMRPMTAARRAMKAEE